MKRQNKLTRIAKSAYMAPVGHNLTSREFIVIGKRNKPLEVKDLI